MPKHRRAKRIQDKVRLKRSHRTERNAPKSIWAK